MKERDSLEILFREILSFCDREMLEKLRYHFSCLNSDINVLRGNLDSAEFSLFRKILTDVRNRPSPTNPPRGQ